MTLRFTRLLAMVSVVFLIAVPIAMAQELTPLDEGEGFWTALIRVLLSFNSSELLKLLGKPQFAALAFIAINLIVFVETGLLLGFFLPGDSLLVMAGLIASSP